MTGTAWTFEDDDAGYVAWIATHPEGFVVNTGRPPRSTYMILHRASCNTIDGDQTKGRSWTFAYMKACSDDRLTVERWCQDQGGGAPSPCGRCHP